MKGLAVRTVLALGIALLAIQQLGLMRPAPPERVASFVPARAP